MFDVFEHLPPHQYFYQQQDGSMRHETEVAVDHAIDFMQENQSNPFVISISFNSPHAEDNDFQDHYPWPASS